MLLKEFLCSSYLTRCCWFAERPGLHRRHRLQGSAVWDVEDVGVQDALEVSLPPCVSLSVVEDRLYCLTGSLYNSLMLPCSNIFKTVFFFFFFCHFLVQTLTVFKRFSHPWGQSALAWWFIVPQSLNQTCVFDMCLVFMSNIFLGFALRFLSFCMCEIHIDINTMALLTCLYNITVQPLRPPVWSIDDAATGLPLVLILLMLWVLPPYVTDKAAHQTPSALSRPKASMY